MFSVASRATGRLQIKPSGSGDENGTGVRQTQTADLQTADLQTCRHVRNSQGGGDNCPRRDLPQGAKSRGGTLVTRACIRESTYS